MIPLAAYKVHSAYAKSTNITPRDLTRDLDEVRGDEKDKKITRLAKSLKQKIDEVIEVEATNKQLREKLKQYVDQNQKNVEIAQEEMTVM